MGELTALHWHACGWSGRSRRQACLAHGLLLRTCEGMLRALHVAADAAANRGSDWVAVWCSSAVTDMPVGDQALCCCRAGTVREGCRPAHGAGTVLRRVGVCARECSAPFLRPDLFRRHWLVGNAPTRFDKRRRGWLLCPPGNVLLVLVGCTPESSGRPVVCTTAGVPTAWGLCRVL